MSKIITIPNPLLRQKSKPIQSPDKKTIQIIRDVEETLKNNERGVGLSAVQIGKLLRVFCTKLPRSGNPFDEKQQPVVRTFINPEITKHSGKKTLGPDKKKPYLEGCLSIPNIWGPIWRYQWIDLKYSVLNPQAFSFSQKNERFSDFHARLIQHEHDHLEGILFTDHSLREKLPLYESVDDKLEEIELPQLSS